MPKLPRWLSFAVLPVVSFFDAGSYYAVRSVLYIHLRGEGGLSSAELGTVLTATAVANLVGTLLAGLAAIAIGPWIPLLAGVGVLMLGAVMLGVLPPEVAGAAALLVGLGQGVARPALFGAAARAFPDFRSEQARNAVFLAMWAASNLAAVIAPELASQMVNENGPALVFSVAAAGAFFASLLAGGLGVAVFMTRDAKAELPPPPKREGLRHVLVIVGILVVGVVPWATYGSAFDLVFRRITESAGGFDAYEALLRINPIAVSVLGALGCGVALGLHLLKVRVPTLLFIGVGLVLVSASTVVFLGIDSPDDALLVPALLLISVGEVMAGPLLFSRIAGDLPERFPTLAVAGFYALTQGIGLVLGQFGGGEASTVVAWVGAILAGLVGIAFALAAFPLQRVLAPSPEKPPAEF